MRKLFTLAAAAAVAAAAAAAPVRADSPGVSKDEVVIGGAHDLSGIFAPFSVPAVTAANLYFDKINAAGGVNGRKITYITEDHGYQVPKAMQAANKLINRDRVFAMLLSLGTPHNLAMFQMMGPQGIPNVYPLSAARQMVDPPASWKFASAASYYNGVKASTRYMAEKQGAKKFCLMILPTDFGKEIEAGVIDGVKESGLEMGVELSHKPDETDFTGAMGRIKESGCDTVGMALGISQMINAIATARKLGMEDVRFLLSSAGFHTVVAKGLAAQGVMSGVFAGSGWQDLEARVGEPGVAEWVKEYTEATGEKLPGTGAILGRSGAEQFVRALEAAEEPLTRESFLKAMHGLKYYDAVSAVDVDYTNGGSVGASVIFISEIENGSWKTVETLK